MKIEWNRVTWYSKLLAVIVLLAALALGWYFGQQFAQINQPANQLPVVQKNSPVKNDLIKITAPLPNEIIASPLTIKGQARGNWYFEASFPVKLVDGNGQVLAQVPAQAKGDWMTTDFVPFEVKLTFPKSTTKTGQLILAKDNPSGLPQNDDSISIPINFY